MVSGMLWWSVNGNTKKVSDKLCPGFSIAYCLAASETSRRPTALSACEVWIGSSRSTETEPSRLDELDEAALLRRDGIGIVYIPLAPNERRVPGFDPFSISTWRREVTADESQSILDVAEVSCRLATAVIPRLTE